MENENNSRSSNENKNNQKTYHKHYRKKRHHSQKPQGVENNTAVKETLPSASPVEESAEKQSSTAPHQNRHNNKKRQRHHKNNKNISRQVEESTAVKTENTEVAESPIEPDSGSLDFYTTETTTATPEKADEELVEIIGVRFKDGGKTYYFAPNNITVKIGEYVIVDTVRGLEFGKVAVANSMVSESEFVPPLRPVIRIATKDDIKHHDENIVKENEAGKICNEKILAHNLDMKLVDVQYTFDNSKLLFYFTSSGRVDFRELVKDLASVFKTRIELRQIGIRDEAKLIGGLGICGRPLCCATFLSDFVQVSIKMAKEQGLFLNSSKISGTCGRLMCCLRYEQDTYEYEIARTPAVDSTVKTPDGVGVVTESHPLSGMIKVKITNKDESTLKIFHRDDVKLVQAQKKPDKE